MQFLLGFNRFAALVLCVVIAVSWFVQTVFPVQSFDFYYHIATGRLIADTQSIPSYDTLSTTAAGTRWITHEWAIQCVMYGLYRTIDIDGLIILKALWLAAVAVLLFRLGTKLKAPVWWTGLLIAITGPVIAFRSFLRPHVVSFGFIGILLFMLYGEKPHQKHSRLIALAVLFWVWGNIHSGVIFGLFVLAVYDLVPRIKLRDFDVKQLVSECWPVIIASAASLANPNTWHSWSYPLKFFRHSELFELVAELRPITTPVFQGGWFIPIFYSLISVAAIIFLVRIKHGSMRELIYLAVFGYLGYSSVRNVPNAALVILPGLFIHGGSFLQEVGKKLRTSLLSSATAAAVLIIPVFFIHAALTDGIPTDQTDRRRFGLGIRELNYPHGSVEYLNRTDIEGNYFNTFSFGGYLLWALYPDPAVFIDGRLFVFIGDVMNTYRNVMGGALHPDELMQKYGVTHLLLSYPETPAAEAGLYYTLRQDRSWTPVYWDDNSMIFVKQSPGSYGIISKDGYRIIHPLVRTMSGIDETVKAHPEEAFREALRAHGDYPRNTGAAVILGRYYHIHARQFDRASEMYELVLRKHPDNSVIRTQNALALMEHGWFAEAEDEWRRIIRQTRQNQYALKNLGISLHRQGRAQEALAIYQQVHRAGYQSPELMNALGIYYAGEERFSEALMWWRRGLDMDPDHLQLQRNVSRAERMMNNGHINREGDEEWNSN
jgi:hypothetical protein